MGSLCAWIRQDNVSLCSHFIHTPNVRVYRMWMCQYLYPPGSCMDSFDKVSCLVGELIFGHPIALGLVSIVIFCCQRYVRSTYRRCFPCIKVRKLLWSLRDCVFAKISCSDTDLTPQDHPSAFFAPDLVGQLTAVSGVHPAGHPEV